MTKINKINGLGVEELVGQRDALIGRCLALTVLTVVVTILAPWPSVIFNYFMLSGFLVIGLATFWSTKSRLGNTWHRFAFVSMDFAWITIAILYPNPLSIDDTSVYLPLRTGIFVSFFIVLAGLTYLYDAWLVIWGGISASVSWFLGVWLLLLQPNTVALSLSSTSTEEYLQGSASPYFVDMNSRVWELSVFLIVTCLLALAVRRSKVIALRQVRLANEKSNLARYFPAQTAELLATKSDQFSEPRERNVAILFADIVDFTRWSQNRTPIEVIGILREVHGMLSSTVFSHNGTLDKFLGDGLMATFGTPESGDRDATNGLAAAIEMSTAFEHWRRSHNRTERSSLKLAVGVHFGPVIIGDVGSEDRLEFAVLGDSVNVANRLEQATRQVGCICLVSEDLIAAAEKEETTVLIDLKKQLTKIPSIELRGRTGKLSVFELSSESIIKESGKAL